MFELRLFTDEQWEDLKTIRLEALKAYPNMLGQPYEEAAQFTKEKWLEWTSDPDRGYFGIYHHQELIGLQFIRIFPEEPNVANINSLYIKPAYHWKGLDKLLFDTAIKWAKSKHCISLKTGCKENNHASKRIIEKHGGVFISKSDEVSTYPDGSSGRTLWYKLDLM